MSDVPQLSPPPSTSGPMVLQVGEQRFFTSNDSLSRSDYLNAIASGRWDSNKQADGSYFIDADPEIFKRVLRFLRHGIYPLCYDNARGHDYGTYAAIQKQADYFIIPELVAWLKQNQYIKAVTIKAFAQIVESGDIFAQTKEAGTKTSYYPTQRTVKKYICPRGLTPHYGAWCCDEDCKRAQGMRRMSMRIVSSCLLWF
ncbi:MAG: hypothetical protein L6R36_007906 [Xanthoria steineri]|nr:MAG: hypothetical protein L6R36_007906 [Xanthoria steineri]